MTSRPDNTRPHFGPRVLAAPGLSAVLALGIFSGVLDPRWGLVGLAVLIMWIFWHARRQLASTFCVFLLALIIGAVVGGPTPRLWDSSLDVRSADALQTRWQETGRFDQDLPIVLHLVFDEMMSPGAISEDLPGGSEIRASLHSLGREFGFRVFDSVYSRNFFSAISLPNVLNAEYLGQSSGEHVATEQQDKLHKNAYFADLERRGYRTAVFQTALMDFCASPHVDLCETFHSFDPAGAGGEGLDLRNRLAGVGMAIVRAYQPAYAASIAGRVVRSAAQIGAGAHPVLGVADRYDVHQFPQWFDRFAAFAARVPRGTHLFAHFMVPHAPYLLIEDCRLEGSLDAGYYLSTRFSNAERAAKRQEYYSRYFDQVRCVRDKIGELLATLQQVEGYRDATIVIHGDHGSRISSGNVLEDYAQRDLLDNYGTFFAIKAPGVEPGIDCRFASLGATLRSQLSDSPAETSDVPLPVMVMSREASGERVETPMPRFGCATDGY